MALLIFIVKLLHIASGVGLIAGLLGREITRVQAQRSIDIGQVVIWMRRSGHFERLLVIPGSQIVIVAGLILAWLQGWPVFGFLQGAQANWLLAALLLSLVPVPIIVLIFLPRGKAFERRLATAVAQGQVTAELTASFHDRVVRGAHVFEGILMAAIVYLMVAKPF